VIGTVAGAWAAAIACIRASPYRFRLRYDRGTMWEYVRFSWPLFVGNATRFITVQGYILVGTRSIGLAATGAITLASQIANYTNRVDMILAETLYPAICTAKDRIDLLFESFVKSNRLALMWGVPFGVGMALFSPDLVHFVLGERWNGAIVLLVTFGLLAAVNHLAYNWDDYFRARGDTKPIAKWGLVNLTATLAITLPLMISQGLDGYAVGMAIGTLVSVAGRFYFLKRIFPGSGLLAHCVRSFAPVVPPAVAILALRAVEPSTRTLGFALAELALFAIGVVLSTAAFERDLLREVVGYLRRGSAAPPRLVAAGE
jgi:O-antigen/teichoic acid export membrane protein